MLIAAKNYDNITADLCMGEEDFKVPTTRANKSLAKRVWSKVLPVLSGKSGVTILFLGFIVLLILVIRAKPDLLGLSSSGDSAEVESLVSTVSQIIVLPTGETPTIATVNEEQLVRGEPFFKNAQNGDKVLVYIQAGRAYLYRPSENRIIEVGVVNQTEAQGENTQDNFDIVPKDVIPTFPPQDTIPNVLVTPSNESPTVTVFPTLTPTQASSPTPKIVP